MTARLGVAAQALLTIAARRRDMVRRIFDRIERNTRRNQDDLYPELALFPTDESRDHARRFAMYRFATTRVGRMLELFFRVALIAGAIVGSYFLILFLNAVRVNDRVIVVLATMIVIIVIYGWIYINRNGVRRRLRLLLISEGVPICPDCGYDLAGVSPEKCPECGAHPLRQAEEVGLRIPAKLQPHHPQNEIDST